MFYETLCNRDLFNSFTFLSVHPLHLLVFRNVSDQFSFISSYLVFSHNIQSRLLHFSLKFLTLHSCQGLASFCIIISEPLKVNTTKGFFVASVIECGHLCRAEETCEAFKHRHVRDDINCQITEGEPKYSTTPNVDENEKWALYTIMKLELV